MKRIILAAILALAAVSTVSADVPFPECPPSGCQSVVH